LLTVPSTECQSGHYDHAMLHDAMHCVPCYPRRRRPHVDTASPRYPGLKIAQPVKYDLCMNIMFQITKCIDYYMELYTYNFHKCCIMHTIYNYT
jgi:hypothetical protein